MIGAIYWQVIGPTDAWKAKYPEFEAEKWEVHGSPKAVDRPESAGECEGLVISTTIMRSCLKMIWDDLN